jgi:glucans biosynthesis protein C
MVIESLFRPKWIGFQNLYDDWANVLLYCTYFIYGYFFCMDKSLWLLVDRQQSLVIGAAALCMSLLLGLLITDRVPERDYSAIT